MKNIIAVFLKELRRYFTDIRMIIGMLLPGLLIFLIYNVMGDVVSDSIAVEEFNVYTVNAPLELDFAFVSDEISFVINESPELAQDDIINGIKKKEIDALVIFEENFMEKIISYDQSSVVKAPNILIYYNSSSESSIAFYNYYTSILTAFESQIANKFDINNTSAKMDLATEDDMSVMIISMMLPFLLMTFLFSGAMGICCESIAGEKERGTIASLLITPIKRYSIVIGKILALGITGLTSAIASFVGLILSLPSLMGKEISTNPYGVNEFILIFLVIVVTVLLFTVLLTMISTYAKSVKEASTLAIPVMLVVMLAGAGGFMQSQPASNDFLYLIPVYNSLHCFRGILSLNINVFQIGIAIISNLLYIGLGVFALARMFDSERIIFNK